MKKVVILRGEAGKGRSHFERSGYLAAKFVSYERYRPRDGVERHLFKNAE